MIRLTKEELNNFIPTNNMVLLESVEDMKMVRFGDLEINIDNDFQPENHVRIINRVVAVPRNLKFSTDPQRFKTMEWDTEMELKYNDLVWINYLAGIKAIQVECEGKYYILIPYSQIYLARREKFIKTTNRMRETVIVLNGYVIIEPITEKASDILDVAEKKNMRVAHVRLLGRPNNKYKNPDLVEDNYIRTGDRVVMKNVHHRKLESNVHARFNKDFYVTQRPRILGILKKRATFKEVKALFSVSVKD